MDIVVCGAGKVGEVICHDLSLEDHRVIIIDQSEKRIDQMIHMADIAGVQGNGSLLDVQREADVDTCDMFIAVTPDDETNIIAAITAKKIGARYVVARVRSPEYFHQMAFLRESLGIDLMINPDYEAARAIDRMMRFPAAMGVESFGHARVFIVETDLAEDSMYIGQSLRDLGRQHGDVLIAAVERDGDIVIPSGDFVLRADDKLYITGLPTEIHRFMRVDPDRSKRPENVIIIGGGRITRYVLPMLQKLNMRLKVIEYDEAVADRLAGEFPKADIICADGTDQAILREERIYNSDAVIALTGIDEENLLISIYASRVGVPKTITKVNRTNLLNVLDNVGLQAIITPRRLIADEIVRFVRSTDNIKGSNIEAFYRVAGGLAEVLQFHVADDSPVCDIPLMDMETKPGLLILCILRDDDIIFPSGSDIIRPNDEIIVVTTTPNFRDVSDILVK
ncbi:MAG: Trk system potassium transporter TrkA [Saccharofermentanales bacterium]|jgi:trk system potassium uptake protein TrkA